MNSVVTPGGQLLRRFTRAWKWNPPYTATLDTPDGIPYVVLPAHCKTGIAAARLTMVPHLVKSAACVLVDGRVSYGARWQCGGNSADVVFLSDPSKFGGMCARCGDPGISDGPGLYRFYDHDGGLLYIGSSSNMRSRVAFHKVNAQWRERIADVQVTSYPTVDHARAAESRAIATERAEINVAGTQRIRAADGAA
jgi:hypothetical protein